MLLAVVLPSTNLAHADKRCCTCVCHGFQVYTWHYTHMGHYNRELSARRSFGSLYSRGCYFQGGVIIQRLRHTLNSRIYECHDSLCNSKPVLTASEIQSLKSISLYFNDTVLSRVSTPTSGLAPTPLFLA